MLDLLQLSPESLELIQSAISAVSSFMSSILSIFIYVGVSVGLFRMSKSCGMKHAWISFIPFLAASITYTVFGCIAIYKTSKLYIPKIAWLAVVLYLLVTPAQPILYLVMGARKPRYVSDGPDEQLPEGGEDMFYTL